MTVSKEKYSKIKSYAGFSLKAGKTAIGTDNILSSKRLHVVITDGTLAENALKKIKSHCEELNCPIYTIDNASGLISKEGCKVFGIKNKSLAKAIINCVNDGAQT